MIRQIVLAGMLLGGSMVFGQEIIAHWDFTKGKIDSVDGKFKMRCRGNTRIAGPEGEQYLDVGITSKDTPEGIISVKKYPELTPQGAFRLEIKARLREPTSKKTYMMLWDNNRTISIYGPHKTNPNSKKGLAVYLIRGKEGKIYPQAGFGFEKTLDNAYGMPMEIEENKDFTFTIEYDGIKKVSFFLNGKLNRNALLKNGGSLVEAVNPLVIGDRNISGYCRFDGQILEVKLTALPSPAK